MGQELAVPDWAKAGPAQAFQSLNPQADNLSDGIGQGYPVLSYKGKVWSLRHRGEKKNFVRLDDGTPSSYLDVVILGQAKSKSKSFYPKFDQDSAGERPTCSSIDGITPDPDVTTKQADACALCPRNVWKTNPQTGKKGRECTDYKRLAVLLLPTMSAPVNNGQPIMDPCFLRVPPASLNSLAIMGDTMGAKGFHYSSYVTRITFDPNKPHPEMQFRPIQGLAQEEGAFIMSLRNDMTVDRIINGGFAETVRTIAPAGASPTGLMQAAQQPTTAAPIVVPTTPTPSSPTVGIGATAQVSTPGAGFGPLVSAPPVTPPPTTAVASALPNPSVSAGPATSAPTGLSPTGFGIAPPAPPPSQVLQQPQASATAPDLAGDAGAPEATDDAMDARVAAMLKAQLAQPSA
jgi:hypothetical protein